MGRLNRNICYVEIYRAAQNTGDGFKKKNIAFPEGNKLLADDFVLIWIKQALIWFDLQRDGTRNGLSNIKTFAKSLLLQMSVLYQRISIFQSSMQVVSQVHVMAEQNVKKKYLMC